MNDTKYNYVSFKQGLKIFFFLGFKTKFIRNYRINVLKL